MSPCKMACVAILVTLFLARTAQGDRSLLMNGKTWWAKYITEDLYTAGRLTPTQIKYLSEVGFKSMISLPTITASSTIGGEHLPAADEEREIAAIANLEFDTALDPGESWTTVTAVEKLGAVYERLPKPVLLHCYSSYSASVTGLAYLLSSGQLSIDQVYQHLAVLGFSVTRVDGIAELLDSLSEDEVSDNPPSPDTGLDTWYNYWLMKPLYHNVFIAGQVESNQLASISDAGIPGVINGRRGVTSGDAPTQEEVSLLNIDDGLRTYTGAGRQTTQELEQNRLNDSLPNEYISETATVNYKSRNPLQFGDDIGYNQTIESLAYAEHGLNYVHLPIGGELGYVREMFDTYRDPVREQMEKGPVLLHCRSQYRSAVLALLVVGERDGHSSDWAIATAAERGIFFEPQTDSSVLELFRTVLGDGATSAASSVVLTNLVTLVIIAFLVNRA